MSGNRVEELEAKVRELEATINGLTDELVETKERLEAIEDEAGLEPDAIDERSGRPRSEGTDAADEEVPATDDVGEDDATETETETEGEGEDGTETAGSDGDDIIVA